MAEVTPNDHANYDTDPTYQIQKPEAPKGDDKSFDEIIKELQDKAVPVDVDGEVPNASENNRGGGENP